MIRILIISCLLIFSMSSVAQRYFKNFIEVDAGIAISLTDVKRYDFAPTTKIQNEIQPGAGAGITFFTTENIGINFGFQYFSLAGVNPDLNLSFTGTAVSPSVNLVFTFNQMFEENLRSPWNRRFKLFGKIGYGRFLSNSNLQSINTDASAISPGSEYYLGDRSLSVGSIPLEISFLYKLNKTHNQFYRRGKDRLYLVISGKVNFLATDELDNYIDRGFSNDALTCFSVGLAYFFGK
ncbi:MAG TPA: hypothetical protein VJ939_09545 [Bacteroidales bacterium]|nr:hypothetical protein [Bacteroidales bacterium]